MVSFLLCSSTLQPARCSFCQHTEIREAKKDIRSLDSYYIPDVSSSQDAGSSLMSQARYNN